MLKVVVCYRLKLTRLDCRFAQLRKNIYLYKRTKIGVLSYIIGMATIGVYDSGIGGLTTLKILLEKFAGNDFYYLADNASHPFGNKNEKQLENIVYDGVCKLKNNSDYVVLACNTASTVYKEKDVFKLLPKIPHDTTDCLLLATEFTIEHTKTKNVKIADTSELASLVEIQASINCKKGNLDMSALLPYIAERLFKFKGVETVILGCSHYPYCKNEISKILGNVRYVDGNETLVQDLEKHINKNKGQSSVKFAFSGFNEEKKYQKILSILQNDKL